MRSDSSASPYITTHVTLQPSGLWSWDHGLSLETFKSRHWKLRPWYLRSQKVSRAQSINSHQDWTSKSTLSMLHDSSSTNAECLRVVQSVSNSKVSRAQSINSHQDWTSKSTSSMLHGSSSTYITSNRNGMVYNNIKSYFVIVTNSIALLSAWFY